MSDLASKIGMMVTELRIINELTQEDLAKKVGTKQSSIARLENGNSLPSLKFLYKIARATDTYLIPPEFNSLKNYNAMADCTSITYYQDFNNNYTLQKESPPIYEMVSVSPAQKLDTSTFNLNPLQK
jgi:transcriptional regulator with XRE-family HTH domain